MSAAEPFLSVVAAAAALKTQPKELRRLLETVPGIALECRHGIEGLFCFDVSAVAAEQAERHTAPVALSGDEAA